MGNGKWKAAGEFAFVSTDKEGLRVATLTGGTHLETPLVQLQLSERQHTAKVTGADYLNKTITLEPKWHAQPGSVFEIGTPGHWTTYTVASVTENSISVTEGGDYYLSRVIAVDAEKAIVTCKLGLPVAGVTNQWVASNETMTKFWRADFLGGSREEASYHFRLMGAPVATSDFNEQNGLYLWEYGVGDQIRQSTSASVRRLAEREFELKANADVKIGLRAKKIEQSTDRVHWRPLPAKNDGELIIAELPMSELIERPVFLRITQ
jgi:hypothetical protein